VTLYLCSYCKRHKPANEFYYHHNGDRYKTCIICRERARKWPSAAKRRKKTNADNWMCCEACRFWDGCDTYRKPYNLPLPCFENPSEKALENLSNAPQEILEVLNEKVS